MKKLFLPLAVLFLLSQCARQQEPVQLPVENKPAVSTSKPAAPRPRIRVMKATEDLQFMPAELCYLDEEVPGIKVDLRYCGYDNFVGRPIDGYTTGTRAILRRDTAECLKRAQHELNAQGLGLLVWDAYRPHRAMKDFYAWSRTDEAAMKHKYYPNITKQGIYDGKYIRRTSEHSLGVAVDVTIINLATGKELDMGTGFDFLDPSSATRFAGITPEQHANRMLLRNTMNRSGMRNYKREWWHYFLKNRGNCTRYDFPLCDTLLPQS